MGKGFFEEVLKPTYVKDVSFANCKTLEEKESRRIQLISDNAVFLNSALALLTDRDKPFLYDEDLKLFIEYVNSTRPEIQERANTLKMIRDNRNAWFSDGSVKGKKASVITIFEYLLEHENLLERSAECVQQDIDLNIAVQKAVSEENFSLKDEKNPIRKAWDELSRKTNAKFKPQDLYASK